ncbi:MAG: 16S rRNA (cytidine(1402)-2'-O)-methyltransferase [Bacteroidetes bacterium]|nr:16S rRNA (cytidine(1402)-2'-O)-methyltransferase [Bacteroidota bacterium]MBU1678120.1 16S rRNA (cytidine(1402)-2'-O)-methyltransferase [Bacteroidota bacterium]MBU2506196.1 16S rRNA (cytidine(1402)-2'-O)-methyltransferase [Bacteroidota bacterium]
MAGKLVVIATPIGNLGDVSKRMIEVLRSVSFIACEDTRVTGSLIKMLDIKNELLSLNAHTEEKKIDYIIERIKSGESCGLVSDAGTPGISDPGIRLVNAVRKQSIEVVGIPGPNAAILALSISGLPTDAFVFEGFLPQKKGRQKKLKQLSEEERTIVIYESVYRIEKLIKELNEYMPERYIVICRELTKKFEETYEGFPVELLENISSIKMKGEFVVVISPLKWKRL